MWFSDRSWWQIAAISLGLNIGIVLNSVTLWRVAASWRGVVDGARPVSTRDRMLTTSTTITNAAALVPAWWLWTENVIELVAPQLWRIPIEVLYLTLSVDLAMYWLHRLFHCEPLYRWFHQIHHTDDTPNNELTLFVMHPLEAAGFGFVVLILLAIWPVSVVGAGIFLTVNLLTGTLAHVLVTGSPSPSARWIGGSALHQAHHEVPGSAYGFFTTVPDRVFGSLPASLRTPRPR